MVSMTGLLFSEMATRDAGENNHPEMKRGAEISSRRCKGCTARPRRTAWDGLLRAAPPFFGPFPKRLSQAQLHSTFFGRRCFQTGVQMHSWEKEGALGLCVVFEHRRARARLDLHIERPLPAAYHTAPAAKVAPPAQHLHIRTLHSPRYVAKGPPSATCLPRLVASSKCL